MAGQIAFIGAGSLGLALAHVLSKKYSAPSLVLTRDPQLASFLNQNKKHPSKLAGREVQVQAVTDPSVALSDAQAVFICTNSDGVSNAVNLLKQYATPDILIILCSKGFCKDVSEHTTPQDPFLSTFIQQNLPQARIAILSGPNFADEIISGVNTITTIAAKNMADIAIIEEVFRQTNITVIGNTDLRGVQCAGACKNIIAIALGIVQGIYQDTKEQIYNHRCAIMMHMIRELGDIIESLGGKANTLLSPAGIGDIMLTCSSDKSRNSSFGIKIGLLIRQFAHESGLNNAALLRSIDVEQRSLLTSKIHKYVSQIYSSELVEGYTALNTIARILDAKELHTPYFSDLISALYQKKLSISFINNYIGMY